MPIDEQLRRYTKTARQDEIIDALIKTGSERKAAELLNCGKTTIHGGLHRVIRQAAIQGYSPEHGMRNPVPSTHFAKGISTLYDDAGNVKQQWVKSNINLEQLADKLREVAAELADSIRGKYKPRKFNSPKNADADIATAIKIGDQHFGMHSWGKETGFEDYGIERAANDLMPGFDYLIQSCPLSETLLIENVGDFFHANDRTGKTPRGGNNLDTDSSHPNVFRAGTQLLRQAIDLALRRFKKVDVINARGNHDPDAASCMNVVLEAYFEKEPRVNIIENDCKFIPWVFGETLLLVNHGEKKPQHQYEFITSRFREQIGKAKNVYVDNGHIHHKQTHEIGCCIFEVWNPLCPPDAWHADSAYGHGLGSRSISSVTYHKEYGEVGRNRIDIRRIRSMEADQ